MSQTKPCKRCGEYGNCRSYFNPLTKKEEFWVIPQRRSKCYDYQNGPEHICRTQAFPRSQEAIISWNHNFTENQMSKIEVILNEQPTKENKGSNTTSLTWAQVVEALQYVGLLKKGDLPHKVGASQEGMEVTYKPPGLETRVQE